MLEPNDVMKVDDKDWEQFKKEAVRDELYYNGPGDLLDTPEGRAKFCRLNESSVFRKPDPDFPNSKIWVFNVQGQGMVIKKRSRVDPSLMEDIEYDADGRRSASPLNRRDVKSPPAFAGGDFETVKKPCFTHRQWSSGGARGG